MRVRVTPRVDSSDPRERSDGMGYNQSMATLSKVEIESALKRVGELGAAEGLTIRLVLVSGGAMVLGFGHRASTKDLDVAILEPGEASGLA